MGLSMVAWWRKYGWIFPGGSNLQLWKAVNVLKSELWIEGQEMKLKGRMGQNENFFLTILELQI